MHRLLLYCKYNSILVNLYKLISYNPMTTTILKKELCKIINSIEDERLLEAVHVLLKSNTRNYADELSEEDIQIVEERKNSYKTGKSKMFTPAEITKKLQGRLKK